MTTTQRLLLIGWDAADWKVILPLLDRGEMPHLARFLEQGVMGDITTLFPVLSPMLWTSIATGMRADRHGVLGFTEVDERSGAIRPVSSVSRQVRALWNMVHLQGGRSHVVNWFCSHPAEPVAGLYVSDACTRPLPEHRGADAVLPETFHVSPDLKNRPGLTASEMTNLRIHPAEIEGSLLKLFVPRAAEIDQQNDRRLALLAKLLAECFTVHNYATLALSLEPWNLAALYYPSLDHFSHAFMPMHPPRLEWITEDDFALYHDVVNSAYRLHDLLLGRLLQQAGEDTTVILVSDHGFHSDHLRPKYIPLSPTGPEVQHRNLGILAMRGPGIRKDERIYGASLLDVAPTALTLLGLPVGQDMPGRVLAEAWETPPAVSVIPSWETVAGEDGRRPGAYSLPPELADPLLEQFVGLGYIDPLDNDRVRAAETTRREARWNLARVHFEAARYDEAVPLLMELYFQMPERPDIIILLADALSHAGMATEAADLLTPLVAERQMPFARYLLGVAELQQGNLASGLEHLLEAGESPFGTTAAFYVRLGTVYFRLRRFSDAARAFQQALDIDGSEPAAWMGLGGCHLTHRRFEDAVWAALQAVGLRHNLPLAHLTLARALQGMNRYEEARRAYEVTLHLRPDLVIAHRLLARLLDRLPNEAERASRHRAIAREIESQRREAVPAQQEWKQRMGTALQENIRRQKEAQVEREVATNSLDLIVVSGLPRSGTSLMMQMLQAGGATILTDAERTADEDNPEGYLEWEAVKKIGTHPELLQEAEGKVVKIISMLLPLLPDRHRYKVLFMDRPAEEVAASQTRMLQRRGVPVNSPNPLGDPERLRRHRDQILARLAQQTNIELLVVDYTDLVCDPSPWIPRLTTFLGTDRLPHPERMAAAVRPDLYRNRRS